MRSIAGKIAEQTGRPVDAVLVEQAKRLLKGRGVQESDEFRRIFALPRRSLDLKYGEWLAERITALYRQPGGRMKLHALQALALEAIHDHNGCVAPITVGGGKTLIALLAPSIVGAKRPMLLVPAKLRDKTHRDVRYYRQHFRLPNVYVESYEKLGRVTGAEILERYAPDMIIADEAQRLKNRSAAVTRRVRRYLSKSTGVRVVILSGTITTRSLMDYAHLLEWALRERSPAPRLFQVAQEWSQALDEKVVDRVGPGVLTKFWNEEEALLGERDPVAATRRAYRRRIVETPGVVASVDGGVETSLQICVEFRPPGPAATAAIETMSRTWETPCGYAIGSPLEKWRHELEMQCGFYYLWDPPAPREWLERRSAWAKVCREILALNRSGLDSELQVAQAIDKGDFHRGKEELDAWRAVRDTFKPNNVPKFIDDTYLEQVEKWVKEAPGIVWTLHVAFGERLSEKLGLPFYSKGGLNRDGVAIESEKGDRPIVASIQSNGEGRNLQQFCRNLVVVPPSTGSIWEQLIGRTHRRGQQADEVVFDVWLGCDAAFRGMAQAIRDARYIQDQTGNVQRLVIADYTGATYDDIIQHTVE
jgi:hypothetical protein